MERQYHGFVYESYIIEKYKIIKEKNYTAKWDGFLNGVPCSTKCIKYGSAIYLGDLFRQAETNEDFYLFIGFWSGTKINIVEEYVLLIPGDFWQSLFQKDLLPICRNLLLTISNNSFDDNKWREAIGEIKKQNKSLITINGKRDHKKQKQFQCSIRNQYFYEYFLCYRKEL